MTKEQFFQQLEEKLRGLPEQERQNIVGVYEDLFERARANGKSEEEVVRSLGYSQLYGHEPQKGTSYTPPYGGESGLKPIIASLALGVFNLMFVLGPVVGIAGVLFGISVAAVALTAVPLLLLAGGWMGLGGLGASWASFEGYAALASFGAGLLLLLVLSTAWTWFGRALRAYIRLNMRLVRGE